MSLYYFINNFDSTVNINPIIFLETTANFYLMVDLQHSCVFVKKPPQNGCNVVIPGANIDFICSMEWP